MMLDRVVPVLASLALAGITAGYAPAALAQEAAAEPTPGPTVEEILARHIEARGGAKAWAAVKALKITGTYTALSEEAEFTFWRQRPGSYRFDYGILGERATEAYSDGDGWMQSPVEGWAWPVPMNGPQRITARSLADFDSPLMDAAARGHRVELVGRSDFDGIDTWELKVTLAGDDPGISGDGDGVGGDSGSEAGEATGNEETWYLDAETYLQVARLLPAVDFGRAVGTQQVFYDDHREVGGVMFPFFIQSEYFIRLNIWTVDTVEINPEIPPGLFTRPPPEGMAKLADLAGTWKVQVESRPAPQAPWSTDGEVTSEIAPRLDGAVLEERMTLRTDGRPVEVIRTYTWDRFRDTYRVAHTDSLSQHLDVYEGTFGGKSAEEGAGESVENGVEGEGEEDADKLILTDVETDTPIVIGQPLHSQIVLADLGPDGFSVEQSVSTDGGETWFANVRLTYSRTRTRADP